jgi:hypothetical protein
MSETAYFMNKTQAEMLATLIQETMAKSYEDYQNYAELQPVYHVLTRGWTFKTPDHEERMRKGK